MFYQMKLGTEHLVCNKLNNFLLAHYSDRRQKVVDAITITLVRAHLIVKRR